MLPDRVSKPGPLTYKSGTQPIALCSPASFISLYFMIRHLCLTVLVLHNIKYLLLTLTSHG